MQTKPTYVINGFLDSGKTSFFRYTLSQPYFKAEGKTLLVRCEEGDEEYGDRLLKENNIILVDIEDEADFTVEKLEELDKEHAPVRILIEYNGMWDFKELKLPKIWNLEQQITIIDASTFPMYFNNMKSLLAEQLRNSELVMFNRCDGIDEKELASYKRNVKAINQQAEIVFEDENGKTTLSLADVGGELLLISQFTLYANCKKGNRPSFIETGAPDKAEQLYEYIIDKCKSRVQVVERGEFGADMKVELLNDGPVTIVMDSKRRE